MAMFKSLTGTAAVGSDVAELQSFATFVQTTALDQIKQALEAVDQRISNTTWVGADATMYAGRWDQEKAKALSTLTMMLNDMGGQAKSQAAQQAEVSAR